MFVRKDTHQKGAEQTDDCGEASISHTRVPIKLCIVFTCVYVWEQIEKRREKTAIFATCWCGTGNL